MEIIKDGTGRGFLAAVNKQNQLMVRSINIDQRTKSAIEGNYFEAVTGIINLSDAVETGVIYLKNKETSTIVVDKVTIDLFPSTGGDANGGIVKYWKNPEVTGGVSITPVNTNFARPDELGVDLKSLLTINGGTVWYVGYIEPKSALVFEEGKFILPPGYAFGISLQAPVGNTSMNINANIGFYRLDLELVS